MVCGVLLMTDENTQRTSNQCSVCGATAGGMKDGRHVLPSDCFMFMQAEIERLTRDRDEIAANRHADAQQWRESIAERDRLRAALEKAERVTAMVNALPVT